MSRRGLNVGMLDIFGSRFEIFEWIREFFGLVSFIGDSGENIFSGDRFGFFLESFGDFRVWRKICGPG